MKYFLMAGVWLYQKLISPLLPHSCIYIPSCSKYTMEALIKHGAFKGFIMGCRRIWRCAPWGKGGFDPVPDNMKGDIKWLL